MTLEKLVCFTGQYYGIGFDYQFFDVSQNQINNYLQRFAHVIVMPDKLLSATIKRQVEFCAGRICASNALKQCGVSQHLPAIIDVHAADGLPIWPNKFVGSISHSENLAVAVVGLKDVYCAVGIDVQAIFGNDIAGLIQKKVINFEDNNLSSLLLAVMSKETLCTIIFSAKEALFKAIYPEVTKFFCIDDLQCVNIFPDLNQWIMMLRTDLSTVHTKSRIYVGYYWLVNRHIISIIFLAT